MPVPTAARGNSCGGFAALKRGAFVLAAALLVSPGPSLQAAPAEPPSQASSAPLSSGLASSKAFR